MFRLFFLFCGLLGTSFAATPIVCPSASLILQQPLVTPIQNKHDSTQWSFRTAQFVDHGRAWFIEFGTFFDDHLSAQQALEAGQLFYSQAVLRRPFPEPMKSRQIVFCDYMPQASAFWVTAVSELG